MADNNDLHITVTLDDSNIDKRLRRLAEGIDRVGDSTVTNGSKLDSINANLRRMTDELNRNVRALNRNRTGVRRLRGEYSLLDNTLTRTMINLGMMEAAFHSVSIIMFGWQKYILDAASNVEKMTIMMKQLSTAADPAKDAIEQVAYVLDFAKNTPHDIDAIRDSFIKLKVAGLDPAAGSMKTLVDANAAFGGNDETLKRASVAIQQMVGKGVVSMEELRQQLGESVPEAMAMMARGLGVSMSQLVKIIESGRLKAKPAIEAMMREFESAFGGAAGELLDTYEGQLSKFQANMKLLAGGKVAKQGYYSAIKKMLEELNTFLESPAGKKHAENFGKALDALAETIIKAAKTLYQYHDVVLMVGKALLYLVGISVAMKAAKLIAYPFLTIISLGGKALTALKKIKDAFKAFRLVSLGAKGTLVSTFGGRAIRALVLYGGALKRALPHMRQLGAFADKLKFIMPFLVRGMTAFGIALGPLAALLVPIQLFWEPIKNGIKDVIRDTELAILRHEDLAGKMLAQPETATQAQIDRVESTNVKMLEDRDRLRFKNDYAMVASIHAELTASGKALTIENMAQSESFMAVAQNMTYYNSQVSGSVQQLKSSFPLLLEYNKILAELNEEIRRGTEAAEKGQWFVDRQTIRAQIREYNKVVIEELGNVKRDVKAEQKEIDNEVSDIRLNESGIYNPDTGTAAIDAANEKRRSVGVKAAERKIEIYSKQIAGLGDMLSKAQKNSNGTFDKAKIKEYGLEIEKLKKSLDEAERSKKSFQNATYGLDGVPILKDDYIQEDLNNKKALAARAERMNVTLAARQDQLRRLELKAAGGDAVSRVNKMNAEIQKQMSGVEGANWSKGIKELANELVGIVTGLEAIDARMLMINGYIKDTKFSVSFVDSLGVIGNNVEKMNAGFEKTKAHLKSTIANFGKDGFNFISLDARNNAIEMLKTAEKLEGASKRAAIRRNSNTFINTYLPQYKSSLKAMHEDQSIQEQLTRFDQSQKDEQASLEQAIKEAKKTPDLQKKYMDILERHQATLADRRSTFSIETVADQIKQSAPLLTRLREEALDDMDYLNQETIKGRLEVFDNLVNSERMWLKERIEANKQDLAIQQQHKNALADLERISAAERAELSRSGMDKHFDQYTNRTEQMNNILIDSFEGISDAINDSLYRQEDGWRQLGYTILEQIGNLILMRYVLEPIADMVENMANSGTDFVMNGLSWLGDALGMAATQAIGGTGGVQFPAHGIEQGRMSGAKSRFAESITSSYNPPSSIGKSSTAPQAVTVNMTNKSGQQLQSKAMQRVTDNGRQQIIDIVLDEINRPGEMRSGLRGF